VGYLFFIGGILYAIKLNIEVEKLYYLIVAVVFGILIRLEIKQKRAKMGHLFIKDTIFIVPFILVTRAYSF
jgi:hypothetical protein